MMVRVSKIGGKGGIDACHGHRKTVVRRTYKGYRKTLAIVNSSSLDSVRYCRMLLDDGRK